MLKKVLIPIVALLVIGGGAYFFLLKPKPAEPAKKVHGVLLAMQPEFLLNLNDGHMAKFTVTLLLNDKDEAAVEIAAAAGGEGHGGGDAVTHPQDGLIRSIITDHVNEASSQQFKNPKQRRDILKDIRKQIDDDTDAEVERVLVTDVVVD